MTKKKGLGPLEHKVMDIVWKQKKSTVYSVVSELEKEKPLAYTTVMTVMTRLAKKDILSREKKGKTFFYKSKQSKEKFVHALVQNTILKMINSFGETAAVAFMDEAHNLTNENKEKLLSKLKNDN